MKPTRARAGARYGPPAGRRSQSPVGQPGDQPRRAEDAEGLAGDVAEQDAQRDRRAEGPLEEAAVDRDPRIGEGEQRNYHVARPWVVDLP